MRSTTLLEPADGLAKARSAPSVSGAAGGAPLAAPAEPDPSRFYVAPSAPAVSGGALETPREGRGNHHGWTIVLISVGLTMIAYCLLIPQVDENRRLVFECEKMKHDLEHLQRQVSVNQEFVDRVGRDPALAERLALRQMGFVRKGSGILELEGEASAQERSPFALVALPAPVELPEPEPVGGRLAEICRSTRSRLYLMGTGLMLLAIGLVLGPGAVEPERRGSGVH